MMFKCIDIALSKSFEKLGKLIGHYPGYFLVIPLLVAIIFVTGVQRMHYEDDPEYLFSPTNGRSKDERKVIDTLFPMNYTFNFNLGRITHKGRFGRLIVIAKDEKTILRKHVFDEIVLLDKIVKNVTVTWDDNKYQYQDLCAKTEWKCFENDILDFQSRITEIEKKKFFLKYPIWINEDIYKAYFFPAFLGGVRNDTNGMIASAKAVNLMYWLDVTIKRGDIRAGLWEDEFHRVLDQTKFKHIDVARFTSTTLRNELEANTQSLVPFFSVTVIIMVLFSVGTCMMADWVKSKPWLGLLGCISAGIGVAASFGLCFYLGVDMIGINLAAPFLMLGVGMDDAFVLIAAWRRTDPKLSVSERLGETYAEAAVSITITSVTNFLSFLIGTITPFPSVRIFCFYTAVAVLFTYVYHITFFGACMVFFGKAEKRKLHALVCIPVIPKSLATDKGCCFQTFCTGGLNEADPTNPADNKDHAVMIFFRDVIANALNKTSIKILVLAVFLGYLGFGIYGCTLMKEGLDRRKLSRDDSYSVKYYDYEDRFFRQYPYRIQVVINKTLNYADPEVQDKVEAMLAKFEASPYVGEKVLTESWLRAYTSFLNQEHSYLFTQALNTSDKEDFNRGLRDIFLKFPMADVFKNDIVFDENGTDIVASRFVIQTKNIVDANMEKEMLIGLREIADSFDLNITIFNQLFIFFDQFILVRDISLQTISVAALVMMVISLVFIPSPICAVWVAFSIISIEIGVIGYMSHWNVNLDTISMINLIMCIGFSVDFSAHICYAYISCPDEDAEEKVRFSLYSLGLPIFQGSVSTILGIFALAFAPSYIFLSFFKTVFLVMLFGALHGVLLLPVLLSLTHVCRKPKLESKFKNNVGTQIPPFGISEKSFDGSVIIQDGNPIFIPKASIMDISERADSKFTPTALPVEDVEDSGQGSKSSASSEVSCPGDKDLGIGTSGEECSEGSWKVSKHNGLIIRKESDMAHYPLPNGLSLPNVYRQKSSKWPPTSNVEESAHVNYGFIGDRNETHNGDTPPNRIYDGYNSRLRNSNAKSFGSRLSAYHQVPTYSNGAGNLGNRYETQVVTAPKAVQESTSTYVDYDNFDRHRSRYQRHSSHRTSDDPTDHGNRESLEVTSRTRRRRDEGNELRSGSDNRHEKATKKSSRSNSKSP